MLVDTETSAVVSASALWRSDAGSSCTVDVSVRNIPRVSVSALPLTSEVWWLLVFEADSPGSSCCLSGSRGWDVVSILVSALPLCVEVGDPLRLFGRVVVLVASVFVRVTLLALLLALFLILLVVLAKLVADVAVWGVAFLGPHVIVGDAAEGDGEDAESEVVKPTDRHLLEMEVSELFVCV